MKPSGLFGRTRPATPPFERVTERGVLGGSTSRWRKLRTFHASTQTRHQPVDADFVERRLVLTHGHQQRRRILTQVKRRKETPGSRLPALPTALAERTTREAYENAERYHLAGSGNFRSGGASGSRHERPLIAARKCAPGPWSASHQQGGGGGVRNGAYGGASDAKETTT